MNVEAAIKLVVAVARALDVPASLVAELFADDDGCQAYFDEVLRVHESDAVPVYN